MAKQSESCEAAPGRNKARPRCSSRHQRGNPRTRTLLKPLSLPMMVPANRRLHFLAPPFRPGRAPATQEPLRPPTRRAPRASIACEFGRSARQSSTFSCALPFQQGVPRPQLSAFPGKYREASQDPSSFAWSRSSHHARRPPCIADCNRWPQQGPSGKALSVHDAQRELGRKLAQESPVVASCS